jgi:hypothetical protein
LSLLKILSKAHTGASKDNDTMKDNKYDAQVWPKKITA